MHISSESGEHFLPTINTALLSSVVQAPSPMKDTIFEHLRIRHHSTTPSGAPSTPFYGPQYQSLVAGLLGPSSYGSVGQDLPAGHHASSTIPLGMSVTEVSSEPVRSKASGRVLCELEALQRKHLQEFTAIASQVVEALRGVVNQHEGLSLASDVHPLTADEDRFWPFNTATAAPMTAGIYDYVMRLAEFSYVSPASVIMGCMLIDRLLEMYPRLLLTRRNVFKLFGVSVRIANKVLDFKTINNTNFSAVLGIPTQHLNNLELFLVMNLQFDLFVSPVDFFWYTRRLAPYHPAVQRLRSLRDAAVQNYEKEGSQTIAEECGPLGVPSTNWSVFSFSHSPFLREKVIQQARSNVTKANEAKERIESLVSERITAGHAEGVHDTHQYMMDNYRDGKAANHPPFSYRLLASENKLPTSAVAAELAPVQRIVIAVQAAGVERRFVEKLEAHLRSTPMPSRASLSVSNTNNNTNFSYSSNDEDLMSPMNRYDSGPPSPWFGSKTGKKVQRARELSKMFAEQLDQNNFLTSNYSIGTEEIDNTTTPHRC